MKNPWTYAVSAAIALVATTYLTTGANSRPTPAQQRTRKPAVIVEEIAGGERVTLADGRVVDKNKWGTGPLTHGLAFAIRSSDPGTVYGIKGNVAGLVVGGGDVTKPDVAFAPGNEPVRATIVDADPSDGVRPSIRGVEIGDSLGGIDVLTFYGVQITKESWSASYVTVRQGSNTGRLRLIGCKLAPLALTGAWSGAESKWPIRCHGHLNGGGRDVALAQDRAAGLEVRDCEIFPGWEWGYVYADNLGPSTISGVTKDPRATVAPYRGEIQIANRASTADPVVAGGPSGWGKLLIENVEPIACGDDGSYALTIAGHLGPVEIRDCEFKDYESGAIVVWSDAGKGLWTTPDGYTVPKLTLSNIKCSSAVALKPHVALDGVGAIVVEAPFAVSGAPRGCIDVDNAFGGPLHVGSLSFVGDFGGALSTCGAFGAGPALRWGGVAWSAAKLDALLVVEPSTKP